MFRLNKTIFRVMYIKLFTVFDLWDSTLQRRACPSPQSLSEYRIRGLSPCQDRRRSKKKRLHEQVQHNNRNGRLQNKEYYC